MLLQSRGACRAGSRGVLPDAPDLSELSSRALGEIGDIELLVAAPGPPVRRGSPLCLTRQTSQKGGSLRHDRWRQLPDPTV